MKPEPRKRNSSFELLRLISMFMILCLHANKDIMFSGSYEISTLNKAFMLGTEALGIVAVDCFVMISGYFTVTSRKLRLRKAAELIVLTSGYGILIFAVMCLTGNAEFSFKLLIKCTAPYFYDKVWFINIYLVLFLLAPFLNRALTSLSKKNYRLLLLISLLLFSVWPSFFPNPPSQDGGYGIVSFVLIYMTAGYIRLHVESKPSVLKCLAAYLIFSIITACLLETEVLSGNWLNYNSVFIIAASVSLFMAFRSLTFSSEKINLISGSVIAVYIIHAHQLIRPLLFAEWLRLPERVQSAVYPLIYLGELLLLFALCLITDALRRLTVQKLTVRLLDKISFFNLEFDI